MDALKPTVLALLVGAFVIGAAGCDTEGPAEETGEELGQEMEEGGEQLDQAIEPEQGNQ